MCLQLEHGVPIEPMHVFESESSVLEWHLLRSGQVVQRDVSIDSRLQSISESHLQFHRESSKSVHLFTIQLLGFGSKDMQTTKIQWWPVLFFSRMFDLFEFVLQRYKLCVSGQLLLVNQRLR